MRLTPTLVETDAQIEEFRRIRNTGVSTFTRNARAVTPEEHQRFWHEAGENLRAWIYADDSGVSVGVGSLHHHDGKLWETLCVLPTFAGRGYGTSILQHMLAQTQEPVWSAVLATNLAALAINERVGGWETADRRDGIVLQVHYW